MTLVFFGRLGVGMQYEEPVPTLAATNELPEILTRREAAAYLRMSERHLRNLIREGLIPEIRAGRRKRLYRRTALIKALESQED